MRVLGRQLLLLLSGIEDPDQHSLVVGTNQTIFFSLNYVDLLCFFFLSLFLYNVVLKN